MRQGDVIKKLNRQINGNGIPPIRRMTQNMKPGPAAINPMESNSLVLGANNQSLETRVSMRDAVDANDYLSRQFEGWLKLWEEFMDSLYFEIITETDAPENTMWRLAELTEKLGRNSQFLSTTQLANGINKLRQAVV